MAIKTVAVYSDADAGAKHVSLCDEAIHIGGSSPKDSYLRWEKIIAAAKAEADQQTIKAREVLREQVAALARESATSPARPYQHRAAASAALSFGYRPRRL